MISQGRILTWFQNSALFCVRIDSLILRDIILSADEEELHEGTAEVLLGLTCLAFAGEGDLAVLDVSKGAV